VGDQPARARPAVPAGRVLGEGGGDLGFQGFQGGGQAVGGGLVGRLQGGDLEKKRKGGGEGERAAAGGGGRPCWVRALPPSDSSARPRRDSLLPLLFYTFFSSPAALPFAALASFSAASMRARISFWTTRSWAAAPAAAAAFSASAAWDDFSLANSFSRD
jgi:hypothetical protein